MHDKSDRTNSTEEEGVAAASGTNEEKRTDDGKIGNAPAALITATLLAFQCPQPASVIRTRVTSIARSSAITRSVITLASPALISSTNRSLLKPCASRMAAVQPSGDASSNSSARRYGAGPLP